MILKLISKDKTQFPEFESILRQQRIPLTVGSLHEEYDDYGDLKFYYALLDIQVTSTQAEYEKESKRLWWSYHSSQGPTILPKGMSLVEMMDRLDRPHDTCASSDVFSVFGNTLAQEFLIRKKAEDQEQEVSKFQYRTAFDPTVSRGPNDVEDPEFFVLGNYYYLGENPMRGETYIYVHSRIRRLSNPLESAMIVEYPDGILDILDLSYVDPGWQACSGFPTLMDQGISEGDDRSVVSFVESIERFDSIDTPSRDESLTTPGAGAPATKFEVGKTYLSGNRKIRILAESLTDYHGPCFIAEERDGCLTPIPKHEGAVKGWFCERSEVTSGRAVDRWESGGNHYQMIDIGVGPMKLYILLEDKWVEASGPHIHSVLFNRIEQLSSKSNTQ